MNLSTGFDKFLEKINLDKTRIDRLISAHNELRKVLKEHDDIKPLYVKDYLQGSYILKTGIKPIKDGEYDVDIILELNLKDKDGNYIMDGTTVLYWLYNIVRNIPAYKDKVDYPKKRSLRIKYANDLRLDISPVHFNTDEDAVLIVPDWKETNPKGFKKWCVEMHDKSSQQFYFVTRILKYWRDIQFGVGSHPKSILLTTLVGNNISIKKDITLNEALLKTMIKLNDFLQDEEVVPEIYNPSLDTELLSENWNYSDFYFFKQKFNTATELLNSAFSEKDEKKTIEILNSKELFNGNFPVTLYEGEISKGLELAESIKKGLVGVTSKGILTTDRNKTVANVPSNFGSHGIE